MRFDKGIKLIRLRPIEGMNGTHRAHHQAGQHSSIGEDWEIKKRYTLGAAHEECAERTGHIHTQADTAGQRKDVRHKRDKRRQSYIRATSLE